MSFNSHERLKQLRQSLRAQEVDAYIINTQDAHASEYLSNSDTRRQYLTGFTGSAGTAIVTASEALLWTDSRYVF
jgi:Xaa-Pro aminopeptidase